MNTFEDELKELKAIFGIKKLLSPADIAPIIGRSVAVLANMRSAGTCPLPVYKIGHSVGFNIRDVAEFLAYGRVSAPVSPSSNLSPPPSKKTPPIRKSSLTQQRNWILAMRRTIDLNNQLFEEVDKLFNKNTLRKDIKTRQREQNEVESL